MCLEAIRAGLKDISVQCPAVIRGQRGKVLIVKPKEWFCMKFIGLKQS
jgi:hypothetical protein